MPEVKREQKCEVNRVEYTAVVVTLFSGEYFFVPPCPHLIFLMSSRGRWRVQRPSPPGWYCIETLLLVYYHTLSGEHTWSSWISPQQNVSRYHTYEYVYVECRYRYQTGTRVPRWNIEDRLYVVMTFIIFTSSRLYDTKCKVYQVCMQ